ncbi:GNAT family N-acetyltransferase, partial [Bacillus tequilensis]|nr:GNAT family N-acetyltransferase [Bacillus tequilensis]
RAGVRFRVVHGDEATQDDLDAMHGFYLQTFAEYGNHPALTLAFLRHLATEAPRSLVMILAEHAGEPIAGALCLRGSDALYGRYWGSSVDLPGLHFETCYYQGIEYCLRNGLARFEPGAQGEHKIARGFLPARVHSHHWIAAQPFDGAIGQWCRREAAGVQELERVLLARSPYRHGSLAREGGGA